MRKTKIKPLTVKDIADRYFKAQCARLGPIKTTRKTASQRAA
jgi:hypothetical protein